MGDVIYRELLKDMTWSHSRVESFRDCPYRFYMKYISGTEESPQFYSSYGSFMHKLLEKYYRGQITSGDAKTEFLTGFQAEVKGPRPSETTVKNYINSGLRCLENLTPLPFELIGIEKKVNFELDGIPFVGYIDVLAKKDGKLLIIDHKSRTLEPRSGKAPPKKKDEELDRMLRQLYLYSAAVYDEFGQFPDRICFNCFRNGNFIDEPFDNEVFQKVKSEYIEDVKKITETEDFRPLPDYFTCNYICPYYDKCCYRGMI